MESQAIADSAASASSTQSVVPAGGMDATITTLIPQAPKSCLGSPLIAREQFISWCRSRPRDTTSDEVAERLLAVAPPLWDRYLARFFHEGVGFYAATPLDPRSQRELACLAAADPLRSPERMIADFLRGYAYELDTRGCSITDPHELVRVARRIECDIDMALLTSRGYACALF